MFRRTVFVAVTVAAMCLTISVNTSGPAACNQFQNSSAAVPTQSIAARWYYRARRGGLNKRSIPSGRYRSQTLQPTNLA